MKTLMNMLAGVGIAWVALILLGAIGYAAHQCERREWKVATRVLSVLGAAYAIVLLIALVAVAP